MPVSDPQPKRTTAHMLDILDERTKAIVNTLDTLSCRVQDAEKIRNAQWLEYNVAHTASVATSTDHEKRLLKLEQALTSLTNSVAPLIPWHKVMIALATILGASVIALLWGIFTHQVTLVFGG